MRQKELNGLRQICIFIVRFYIKAWFNAPSAIKAPNQDLTAIQDLIKYKKTNAQIADAAITKLCNHLWYLSEHLAALAFFDDTVSYATKLKMARASKSREGTPNAGKRLSIEQSDYESLLTKDISDFISKKSITLFTHFELSFDFLDVDPGLWEFEESFIDCVEVFKTLEVVNDVAERGVALIEEFNLLLTCNEDQKQYLLKLAQEHRKRYPDCQKQKLAAKLN